MVQFFTFPVKDDFRCSQWVLNSGNDNLLELSPSKLGNRRVCSKHFARQMIINRSLVHDAVPMSYDDVTLTYEGECNNDVSTIDLHPSKPEARTTRPFDSEALSPDSPLTIAELLPANILASALKGLPPSRSVAKVVKESPSASSVGNARHGSPPESPPVILVEESPVASPPVFLVEDSPPASPRENAVKEPPPREELIPSDLTSEKNTSRLGRSKLNKPTLPRVEDMAQISWNTNPRLGPPCRLCMEIGKTPKIPIFRKTYSETHLITKIFSVTGIQMKKGDGLPTYICQECNESINDWFEFKQVCISADKSFKSARKQRMKESSSHAGSSHDSQLDLVTSKRAKESCQVVIDAKKPVEVNRKSVEHNKLLDTSAHFVDSKRCDDQNIGLASTGVDSKHRRANESCKVIIDSNKPVEVTCKSVEHKELVTSSAHLLNTNRYDDQNIEQVPADVEGDSTHETLPPAFVSVKIEPNNRGSMWNPEMSLKYAGDCDNNVPSTSELPPVEYEVLFGSDVVCEAGEKALMDPLSLPTSDKAILSSRHETTTPINLQTLRKLLTNTGTKPKSYLLAVKPVSAPSEEPPTYVLAMNPPTSGSHGSIFPGNIRNKISNLPVIKNVSVPLTSKPDMTKLYDLYRPRKMASSNRSPFTIKVPTVPLKTVPDRTIESNVTEGVATYNRTPRTIKVSTVPLNTMPDITKESNLPRKRSGDPLDKASPSGTKISKGSPSIS